MWTVRKTPQPGGGQGASSRTATGGAVRGDSSTAPGPRQAVLRLRGRTVAKLAIARPLGQLVLAQPYRHRRMVSVVSQHRAVLTYARRAGARLWVVRDDQAGRCWAVDLLTVEQIGWLRRHRDGHPEVFVPLAVFRAIPWTDWAFVTEPAIDLDELVDAPGVQLALPGLGG